jgi:phospholipid/cholesterol/gamma-HCH transport system ATP-binding protein
VENNVPVIEIKDLYKSFGEDKDVLIGLNLSVKNGENLMVLGKSGSGKSIAIKCLVGLVKTDSGQIKVLGTDITKLDEDKLICYASVSLSELLLELKKNSIQNEK